MLGGLILCLTIVGIPFGLQCFKIAQLGLFPFGKDFVSEKRSVGGGIAGLLLNVFWFCIAGVWIFLAHLALGLSLALTLIGIPFAIPAPQAGRARARSLWQERAAAQLHQLTRVLALSALATHQGVARTPPGTR